MRLHKYRPALQHYVENLAPICSPRTLPEIGQLSQRCASPGLSRTMESVQNQNRLGISVVAYGTISGKASHRGKKCPFPTGQPKDDGGGVPTGIKSIGWLLLVDVLCVSLVMNITSLTAHCSTVLIVNVGWWRTFSLVNRQQKRVVRRVKNSQGLVRPVIRTPITIRTGHRLR